MSTSGGNWKDLVKAAEDGTEGFVRYHLRSGVDPNFQHPEFFTTPLCTAIRAGNLSIVKILVEEGGSDPGLIEELSCDSPIELARQMKHFEIVDYLNSALPVDLQLKIHNIVVTGACRGIGKAIARSLLNEGHRVLLTCRSLEKAESVAKELVQDTGNEKVSYVIGYLDTIKGAYNLAFQIKKEFPNVDRLILNAGIWPTEKIVNADGLEESFMVNFMAQYILCDQLIPILSSNGPSRVVFVGAGLYVKGQADIAFTPTGKDFSAFRTYANTKQCAVILMSYLARHVEPEQVVVNAVHPGVIETGLGATYGFTGCLLRLVKTFWKTPEYGAAAPCWVVLDGENAKVNGQFFNEKVPMALTESVTDLQVQEEWIQWTKDYLSRSDETTEPGD